MKRKKLLALLFAEGALCILLLLTHTRFPDLFTTIFAFPFEQIGLLLRTLSLSGKLGNACSLMLYGTISLLPFLAITLISGKRKLRAEDGLLPILSLLFFVVLYLMSNPYLIGQMFGNAGISFISIGKAILGGLIDSVFIGWMVLRLLRLFSESETKRLVQFLSIMLEILSLLFLAVLMTGPVHELLNAFSRIKEGTAGYEGGIFFAYGFIFLKFFVRAMPWFFDIITIFLARDLLDAMCQDRYSQASIEATEKLSRWCIISLSITVISEIVFNLIQIVFARTLLTIDTTLTVPLISIAFVLAVLLLARIVAENRTLKQDNDLFI